MCTTTVDGNDATAPHAGAPESAEPLGYPPVANTYVPLSSALALLACVVPVFTLSDALACPLASMLLRHDFSPQNAQGMFGHHMMGGSPSDHHDKNGLIGLSLVPDFTHGPNSAALQQMKQSYYIPKQSGSGKSSSLRAESPVNNMSGLADHLAHHSSMGGMYDSKLDPSQYHHDFHHHFHQQQQQHFQHQLLQQHQLQQQQQLENQSDKPSPNTPDDNDGASKDPLESGQPSGASSEFTSKADSPTEAAGNAPHDDASDAPDRTNQGPQLDEAGRELPGSGETTSLTPSTSPAQLPDAPLTTDAPTAAESTPEAQSNVGARIKQETSPSSVTVTQHDGSDKRASADVSRSSDATSSEAASPRKRQRVEL